MIHPTPQTFVKGVRVSFHGSTFQRKQMLTPIYDKNLQVLQLFLDPHLDLNRDGWPTLLAVDLWRCSPLHRAAESGKTEVCFDFFLG